MMKLKHILIISLLLGTLAPLLPNSTQLEKVSALTPKQCIEKWQDVEFTSDNPEDQTEYLNDGCDLSSGGPCVLTPTATGFATNKATCDESLADDTKKLSKKECIEKWHGKEHLSDPKKAEYALADRCSTANGGPCEIRTNIGPLIAVDIVDCTGEFTEAGYFCRKYSTDSERNACRKGFEAGDKEACRKYSGKQKKACEDGAKNSTTSSGSGTTFSRDPGDCKEANFDSLDENNCGIIKYIALITNVLSGIAATVIVAMIVVAGIQYSTAGADASKVQAAKQKIINALLALFLLIFGYAILQWLVPGGIF